jgi:hypothetical protein
MNPVRCAGARGDGCCCALGSIERGARCTYRYGIAVSLGAQTAPLVRPDARVQQGDLIMPEKSTIERAQRDKREGKSPSTQAGEFVREEMHHIREGKHGATSAKQAVAIGLSKARRAGVKLRTPKKGQAKSSTRKSAQYASEAGQGKRKPHRQPRVSRAVSRVLKHEPRSAASHRALSHQAKSAASRRSASSRSAAARKAARTKGPAKRSAAARKAARTRARHRA